MGGLENVSGSALGRQECGEGGGELNLVGEGASEVYWTVELHWVVSVTEVGEFGVGRVDAQEDEAQGSQASTSRGDAAGKQQHGGENARAALHGLRPRGTGARDPYRDTVASSIPPFPVFCKIHPTFELKSNFHQNKSCSEF